MKFDFNEWHSKIRYGEVLLDFKGNITPEVIANHMHAIEEKLNDDNIKIALRKKVYLVAIEAFQNLYHHVDSPPKELAPEIAGEHFGFFLVCKDGPFFRVSTGNFIKKEKVRILKDRIDQINSLSDYEVKVLYRDILNNNEFSSKGGGGMGMLDIVKKTGNKLDYFFYQINEDYYFYSLDIYIS